jgi:hypothetical protein
VSPFAPAKDFSVSPFAPAKDFSVSPFAPAKDPSSAAKRNSRNKVADTDINPKPKTRAADACAPPNSPEKSGSRFGVRRFIAVFDFVGAGKWRHTEYRASLQTGLATMMSAVFHCRLFPHLNSDRADV